MNLKAIYSSVAAVILGSALTSLAAPTVTLSLVPTDATSGDPLPTNASGQFIANPGEQVTVTLEAAVSTPNVLGSTRAAAVKGKGLGVSTITTNIVSVGTGTPAGTLGDAATSGDITPVADGTQSGTQFQAGGSSYNDLTPDGIGFGFVNLNDLGADGDLDVNGTGFAQPSNSIPTTTTALAKYQYGVAGSADGSPIPLVSHVYTYNGGSTPVVLETNTLALNVFNDTGGTTLAGVNDLSGVVEGSITFAAAPEPASLSLLGLGAMGLIARRRKA